MSKPAQFNQLILLRFGHFYLGNRKIPLNLTTPRLLLLLHPPQRFETGNSDTKELRGDVQVGK